MTHNSKGFTLIELMIVIAIIWILATMVMPSFQDRIIRAQVEEAFNLSDVAQAAVQEYYAKHRAFPANNAAAGLPAPEKMIGNYVTRVAVDDGVITVTLGNRINKNAEGETVAIRPAIVKDEPMVPIAWVYGYASVPEGMTVIGDNTSTILPRLLPVSCRY